ncbi:hypothetical protein AB0G04_35100 [Actinoplanes sp. NPDC023801]|uniref:TY-Chap domain-containing protein n=1 Tax=Actinoplanes sp. NPDC023801 TaxID=3154595 RepID=UPI0033C00DA1
MNASSWEELTSQLAVRLPLLEFNDVIQLTAPGNRWTELMQLEDSLALDAVSNEFLPPDGQLDAAQEQEMRNRGWQSPLPLWTHQVDKWPLNSRDAARVADLMVSTLRDVYRVADPSDIEVTSFNASPQGTSSLP